MRGPEGRRTPLGEVGWLWAAGLALATGGVVAAFSADFGVAEDESAPQEGATAHVSSSQEMSAPDQGPEARDPLGTLLTEAPGDLDMQDQVLSLVRDAADALDDDRPDEARVLYDSLAVVAPTLADWVPVFQAEVAAEAGEPDQVARFLEEAPREVGFHERWQWRFSVRALEAAGDTIGAAEEARRLALRDLGGQDQGEAYARSADLFLEAADTTEAVQSAWLAVETAPTGAPGRTAAALLLDLPELPGGRERELGKVLLDQGDWEGAWEHLEEAVRASLDNTDEILEPSKMVEMARGLVEMEKGEEALDVLDPLDSEAVADSVRSDALYWRARALLDLNRVSEGRTVLERVADLDPSHRAAGRAQLRLAEKAADDDEPETASRHLRALANHGHRTSASDLLTTRLASRSYMDGRYDEAMELLDGYRGTNGNPVPDKVRHWESLILEARGETDAAHQVLREIRESDPFGFHGVAAAHRLDLPLLDSDTDGGPGTEEDLSRETANAVLRLQVHRYVPTPGSFAFELERLEDHFLERGDAAAYSLAEALIDGELTTQGILLGRELHRRAGEWNLRLLRIVYPFPYRQQVARSSHERDLDPFLVAGLIRQESMFRPDARSPAGAVGLMQLMPATARQVAQQQGMGSSLPPSRLEDPSVNLRLGTHFLRQMLNQFDGSVTDALAAYNAGPGNASRWQGFDEHSDVNVFVPHIPFRETRHYVRIVQQNARIYAALYGCGEFQACPGLSYAEWVEQTQPLVRPPTAIPAR